MKLIVTRISTLSLLAVLLVACEFQAAPLPTPSPTPPAATRTSTVTPLPPTETIASPTSTRKPSSTPVPTRELVPVNTVAYRPTPVPGWVRYTNEYLGYGFNYPAGGVIHEIGANGMDANEVLPPGFTFDEYFHYVMAILPEALCVSVEIPGAFITIAPPYPLGSYTGPCPGMGIGTGYRWEMATETWTIAGRDYEDFQSIRLYLEATGAFYAEFYVFKLQNGFRVVFNGKPEDGMLGEEYQAQRIAAQQVLTTLHWFQSPNLTKPGTTCAGGFTRLMPSVLAVVAGEDTTAILRSQPEAGGNPIARLLPGTVVKVLEGPQCVDGLVYWKVESEAIPGGAGWTAEGDGQVYWLERYKP